MFDASTVVSAALKADSGPEQALLRAQDTDIFALSTSVHSEIAEVLGRPKFARLISHERRERILRMLRESAIWFEPPARIGDCRDAKDNKYLDLALAAAAEIIVSSDDDLLILHPWRGIRILRPAAFLACYTNRP